MVKIKKKLSGYKSVQNRVFIEEKGQPFDEARVPHLHTTCQAVAVNVLFKTPFSCHFFKQMDVNNKKKNQIDPDDSYTTHAEIL